MSAASTSSLQPTRSIVISPRTFLNLLIVAGCSLGIQLAPAQAAPGQQATDPNVPHAGQPRPQNPAVPAPIPQQPQVVPADSAPETPHWPANDEPKHASVTWDSQGLHIDATNSSLQQVLADVSTATGTKIEGLSTDERIFGEYGPGQARDVLSQLLHGSGYNFLLIGDQGQGTPRQIVLSPRHTSATLGAVPHPNADASDDDAPDPEPEEQTIPRPPPRPDFGGPDGPRNPQMMRDMMLMRQQQMQQQQQQNGGQPAQNNGQPVQNNGQPPQ